MYRLRRIMTGLALLFYCAVLYAAFDLAYTAVAGMDSTRFRIFNAKYHHALAANFDGTDRWGERTYRLITNDLGFRDAAVRKVIKKQKEKRILVIGDSFTEGIGLPFEETFAGMLYQAGQARREKVEILNAGLSSYSPAIYFKKIQTLLEDGYQFDEVVVFSDPSDVQDEATSYFCIDDDPKYRTLCDPQDLSPKRKRTKSFVSTYMHVTDAIGDWIEKKIPYFKVKDPPLYEFRRVDWLYSSPKLDHYRPLGIEGGITRSLQNMGALAKLLSERGIPLTIVVYPWPAQVAHNDHENRQIDIWKNFCRDRCKDFINLFPVFYREQTASPNWYEPLYIPGDVHFSKLGNELVFRAVAPRILGDVPQN